MICKEWRRNGSKFCSRIQMTNLTTLEDHVYCGDHDEITNSSYVILTPHLIYCTWRDISFCMRLVTNIPYYTCASNMSIVSIFFESTKINFESGYSEPRNAFLLPNPVCRDFKQFSRIQFTVNASSITSL